MVAGWWSCWRQQRIGDSGSGNDYNAGRKIGANDSDGRTVAALVGAYCY